MSIIKRNDNGKSATPTLIVANTIKGKGVSFMENVPIWHYRMPNEQELPILMKELGLTEDDLKVKEV
jgi:transketolase